jgi:hypothetical protein
VEKREKGVGRGERYERGGGKCGGIDRNFNHLIWQTLQRNERGWVDGEKGGVDRGNVVRGEGGVGRIEEF